MSAASRSPRGGPDTLSAGRFNSASMLKGSAGPWPADRQPASSAGKCLERDAGRLELGRLEMPAGLIDVDPDQGPTFVEIEHDPRENFPRCCARPVGEVDVERIG